MLYDSLPDSAISKREDPDQAHWGPLEELLAQLVEEVSVLVADKRRKDPRTIPRPWDKKNQKSGLVRNGDSVQATGHHAMLAAAQMRGAVKLGG